RLNLNITRGNIYNIGGGAENTISLLELIEEIEKLTGIRLEYVLDERRLADQYFYVTDYSKICRHTGWKPEINIRQTLELLRNFWEENRSIFGWRTPDPVESYNKKNKATWSAAAGAPTVRRGCAQGGGGALCC